jgi:hypothetical protein
MWQRKGSNQQQMQGRINPFKGQKMKHDPQKELQDQLRSIEGQINNVQQVTNSLDEKLYAISSTQTVGTGALEKQVMLLNESLGLKIDALNDSVYGVNLNVNILNDTMHATNQNVNYLRAEVKKQAKTNALHLAIQNCVYNSFQYRIETDTKSSEDLVRRILFSFQQDHGYTIPRNAGIEYNADDKSRQEFRDKLVNQLYQLTGVKPRIVFQATTSQTYVVYYS